MSADGNPIIIFDGECGMCNRFVVFVLRRDPDAVFRFVSNSSDYGRKLLAERGAQGAASKSIVVIDGDRMLTKSDAILTILTRLETLRFAAGALRLVPRPLRDFGYSIIARWRYALFGKVESCQLIPHEWQSRIVDNR